MSDTLKHLGGLRMRISATKAFWSWYVWSQYRTRNTEKATEAMATALAEIGRTLSEMADITGA
jgi:hypothetical protein